MPLALRLECSSCSQETMQFSQHLYPVYLLTLLFFRLVIAAHFITAGVGKKSEHERIRECMCRWSVKSFLESGFSINSDYLRSVYHPSVRWIYPLSLAQSISINSVLYQLRPFKAHETKKARMHKHKLRITTPPLYELTGWLGSHLFSGILFLPSSLLSSFSSPHIILMYWLQDCLYTEWKWKEVLANKGEKNNKNARSCCIERADKFLHILLGTHTQIPSSCLLGCVLRVFLSDAHHNSFSPTVLITIFTHILPLGSSMSCRNEAREGLIANIVDCLIRSGTSCTIKSRLAELATQSSSVTAHNERERRQNTACCFLKSALIAESLAPLTLMVYGIRWGIEGLPCMLKAGFMMLKRESAEKNFEASGWKGEEREFMKKRIMLMAFWVM